jgi:Fur family ferric uptake transcriptional regulator
MPPAIELDAVAAERLRRDGQRYTDGRRALVAVLAEGTSPLTIPQVLERRPHLAQSSVYRNLAVLERAGVVQRIVTTGEWARYELAEDLTEHHHHLICSACGVVDDFRVSAQLERSLNQALGRVAGQLRFQVQGHRLDLVGLCERCQ